MKLNKVYIIDITTFMLSVLRIILPSAKNMNQIVQTNKIEDVLNYCKLLREKNPTKEFILYLDIDDTVLSSTPGTLLVDTKIRDLIAYVYNYNKDNLCFCTARNESQKHITQNQLNHASLVHTGFRKYYRILYSPYATILPQTMDKFEELKWIPTKGTTIVGDLTFKFQLENMEKRKRDGENFDNHGHKDYVILFVDDCLEQIEDVHKALTLSPFSFKLFHYTAHEDVKSGRI